ncbi:molybdenum cofactor guanylyltransferase [Oerskovia enterophila]|uniref:Molybdenum cofactor guanylyltransferase n=1 Tax=Oerskovia enterophila TaxID=43678 RepID=A0ABX2Y093_9CELL|nr:NTP transferase domain-containing protein [Oerskovia enterophila]OCI29752.1 molybdenum cofactor guanylyltransferase [Oerskovia enterophila]
MSTSPPPEVLAFDAVVLAGGRARRLGTSKPQLVVDGARLLDHVLAATRDARATVVVGPADLASPAYVLTREDPPFGGPVAGTAAGLAALPDGAAPWVLLLACDVPRAAEAVPLLVASVAGAPRASTSGDVVDGVHLAAGGKAQWLVGLYRREALDAAVARVALEVPVGDRSGGAPSEGARTGAAGGPSPSGLHGAPVRRLVSGLRLLEVEDVDGLSTDVDTWQDAESYAHRRAQSSTPSHDLHGSSGGMA